MSVKSNLRAGSKEACIKLSDTFLWVPNCRAGNSSSSNPFMDDTFPDENIGE